MDIDLLAIAGIALLLIFRLERLGKRPSDMSLCRTSDEGTSWGIIAAPTGR